MREVFVFVVATALAVAARAESMGIKEEVWVGDDDSMFPPDMGAPCTWADDCQEAVCLHTSAGGVCSRYCVEECPDGWACTVMVSQDTDDAHIVCSPGGEERALAPRRPFTSGDATTASDSTASQDVEALPSVVEEPMNDLGPTVPDTPSDPVSDVTVRVQTDVSRPAGNAAQSGGCHAVLVAGSRDPALRTFAFLAYLGLFHRAWRRSRGRPFSLRPPEP